MSKKALTVDLSTGKQKLDTIIDDVKAIGNTDISYSGKFVDDNLLSIAHDSSFIGNKQIDETNITNKYVVSYDEIEDKLVYTKTDSIIEIIDCGTF